MDYLVLAWMSIGSFLLGMHSARLKCLERRIEALEGTTEEEDEGPEEDDGEGLDGNRHLGKPHFDVD